MIRFAVRVMTGVIPHAGWQQPEIRMGKHETAGQAVHVDLHSMTGTGRTFDDPDELDGLALDLANAADWLRGKQEALR